ncbi:MAG: GH116 family glycosyl-hydrolase [Planctomycetota bacterium]
MRRRRPSGRAFIPFAALGMVVTIFFPASALGGEPTHPVPGDKKLDPKWVESLFAVGQRKVYRNEAQTMIGMPVGGIACGQLYIGGDGRLMHWDIFNRTADTSRGGRSYETRKPVSPVDQGFAVRVTADEKTHIRTLDRRGFPNVGFTGEYPIALVEYREETFPLFVTLKAFSPFIPLNAPDSALPVTLLRFTLENPGLFPAEVVLAGWLENAVCLFSGREMEGFRQNRIERGETFRFLECTATSVKPGEGKAVLPPTVFEDFEGGNYGKWVRRGDAFGPRPMTGPFPGKWKLGGFKGKALVMTYWKSDKAQGRMLSPAFTLERPYINFLIGGGNRPGSARPRGRTISG